MSEAALPAVSPLAGGGLLGLIGKVAKRPGGLSGLAIMAAIVVAAVTAPLIAPYGPADQDMDSLLRPPSWGHLLGTDHLGRDLLSRLIFGSRIALATALPAVSLSVLMGLTLGLTAGFLGGAVDAVIVTFLDAIMSFPTTILALALMALLGPSLPNLILVIAITWMPFYARLARAEVLSAKQNDYVEAEIALGASTPRIIAVHIFPNIVSPIAVAMAMDLPVVITTEAGFSFLGLGVRPPQPSWGVILSDGFDYIRHSPWPILFASLTLMVATLGFTRFGEALRDVLDPRFRGMEAPR